MPMSREEMGSASFQLVGHGILPWPFPSLTEWWARIGTGLVGRMPTSTGWKPALPFLNCFVPVKRDKVSVDNLHRFVL
jgi:hypothetical protein